MYVYLGQIAVLMRLRMVSERQLYFTATCGWFLLTGEHIPPQVGHNDFDHTKGDILGFFIMMTGREGSRLWVLDGSHKYITFSKPRRLKLAYCFRMKELLITPYSVFVGNGYVHYTGSGWILSANLRYHKYLLPSGNDFLYLVSFALEWSKNRDDEDSLLGS